MIAAELDSIIAEILSAVLGRTVEPGEAVSRSSDERWDSLKHMEIILAAESAFGVTLSERDIAEIRSVADLKGKVSPAHAT